MATLIKRPGSPFFFAAFDVPQPDGTIRRLKRSTKRRKRSEAQAEANRIEEAETRAAVSTPESGGKAYLVLKEAAEAAARGELSEARARELISKLTEISTGSPLTFYTVRSWSEDWLATKAAQFKPATLKRYRASIAAFLAWMGERADSRLEAVTKADVRGFRDAIRNGWNIKGRKLPKRSASTTNGFSIDIAGLFSAAVRQGILLASPAAALETLPEDDSTEREVFTFAEVSRLVEAAERADWQRAIFSPQRAEPEKEAARSRDWPGLILVGFYAGPRLKDAATLTWGNIDLDSGVITFAPAKTSRKKKRKELEVPIHPRLASFLESHDTPRNNDAPIFPSLAGAGVGGKVGLSSCFGAIMDAAEIDRRVTRETERDKDGKSVRRAINARSFHSLRHSLTSSLANLDVAPEIRQRIVGHDSATTHQGYTHAERATLARAVEKLPHI